MTLASTWPPRSTSTPGNSLADKLVSTSPAHPFAPPTPFRNPSPFLPICSDASCPGLGIGGHQDARPAVRPPTCGLPSAWLPREAQRLSGPSAPKQFPTQSLCVCCSLGLGCFPLAPPGIDLFSRFRSLPRCLPTPNKVSLPGENSRTRLSPYITPLLSFWLLPPPGIILTCWLITCPCSGARRHPT